MTDAARRPRNRDEPTDSPTVWFALLEQALITGDRDLELRARQELGRLGVQVTVSRSRETER